MYTLIIFIIVLSILVFVHELGHFYVAKKFGLKPKEFGFGFPPRLWGVYKNQEGKWKKVYGNREVKDNSDTIYSINWIPLGGFVNIGEDEEDSDDPNHFVNQKPWKRIAILSAGVIMNVVLAAVLISIGFMIGFPQIVDKNIDASAKVSNQNVQVVEVLDNSPSREAGFKTGDIILSINSEPVGTDEDVRNVNGLNLNQEVTYKIKRKDEIKEIKVTPEIIPETGEPGIGIAIVNSAIIKYPWYIAIIKGVKTTFVLLWLIIVAFYELFKGLFLGHGLSADLGGPVYIAKMVGDSARMGIIYLTQLTALLSINLAVINFLPFPALDGGRVLFIIIEKLKGKPVKREVETAMHYIGFILLMLLVIVVTFRDVLRIWNGN